MLGVHSCSYGLYCKMRRWRNEKREGKLQHFSDTALRIPTVSPSSPAVSPASMQQQLLCVSGWTSKNGIISCISPIKMEITEFYTENRGNFLRHAIIYLFTDTLVCRVILLFITRIYAHPEAFKEIIPSECWAFFIWRGGVVTGRRFI